MPPTVKIAQFEGPLDLLLQLVTDEDLPITEISLTEITEHFLEQLNKRDDRSENMADFLVLASRLLYLKSRVLLPYLYPEEAESGPGLVDQLKLYKRYVDASELIRDRWTDMAQCYGRTAATQMPVTALTFPTNANTSMLRRAMETLLKRWKPLPSLPQLAIDRSLSVKETIAAIVERLRDLKRFQFSHLLGERPQKTDVIVHFLALLELCKRQEVCIFQSDTFADFMVERV